MISFEVAPEDVGERIDVVVARRTGATRALVQRALRGRAVTVAGREVRPSYRLEAGDRIAGELPEAVAPPPEPVDLSLEVRYDDDRVLVVSKPAGLVTHPAPGHKGVTLVHGLLALGGALAGGDSTRPGIVHRLDRDTSGLLLVARDDESQRYLVDALRQREIARRYLALVRSPMPAATGTIEAPIDRHPSKRWVMAVVPGGRPSVTHYRVTSSNAEVSLLEVSLETGRTHQIRVHLSHLGRPVLGDRSYGGVSEVSRGLGLERPFLHAGALAFPHPDDGRRIEVADPLPDDLREVLERAGLPDG
ncbi:MAG: RluA family pseudouridine synthase [Actinomycetota bacterium]